MMACNVDWRQVFVGTILGSWILVSYYSASVSTDWYKSPAVDPRRGASSSAILRGLLTPNPMQQPQPAKNFMQDLQNDGDDDEVHKMDENATEFSFSQAKKILYFTPYFDMEDYEFGFGHSPFLAHNCPVTNCWATNNRTALGSLGDFDAVLFHMRDMPHSPISVPNQRRRKPHQRYVMFLMESPQNDNFPYSKLKGFFNWTMTYRFDSDIPRPYGWVEPIDGSYVYPTDRDSILWRPYQDTRAEEVKAKYKEVMAKKDKKVAWIVSNCNTNSQREAYVKGLKMYIDVDVMGQCGDIKCDDTNHRKAGDNCTLAVDERYKFYLSFENSICDDYATEKFFKRLALNTVPIVLGGADYKRLAPPHSYIHVDDFASPKKLAEFLHKLDKNDDEYLSYFWWKSFYRSQMTKEQKATSMCLLCAKLNDPDEPRKTYPDIEDWWRSGSHCRSKNQHPWSEFRDGIVESILNRVMG